MARIDQRAVLGVLTRPRLYQIAAAFEVSGASTSSRKAELVEAVARSPRAPVRQVLARLRRDELKAICRSAGIDDSGREKAQIIERLLRRFSPSRPRRSAPAGESSTLKKADLVEEVVEATGLLKKTAEEIVGATFETLSEALQSGGRVEIRGFGSFGVRCRGARIGRNPRTGAEIEVPAKRIVYFKPGKELRWL